MNRNAAVGAGAFLVVGVSLFTVALFMIGERRMLFERRFKVHADFSSLGQLENGAMVRVNGLEAGATAMVSIPRLSLSILRGMRIGRVAIARDAANPGSG